MPTELYEEWHKRSQERGKGEWHPSYREHWTGNACADSRGLAIREYQLDAYFSNYPATLWGRAWDVSQVESVEGAKRWLMGVLGELGIEVVE